jgi:uncharacterized membrane-anchored protein YhcB (DUF1043 family)
LLPTISEADMAADPFVPVWLMVVAGIAGGAVLGVLLGTIFERTRGPAARRAAKFEAELMQARSDLIHYRDQTKHHFGKSAELLGRMASDYREFLDHFVTGAEELCGPNLKELNASGLDRPMLERATPAPTSDALPAAASTTPLMTAPRDAARTDDGAAPPLDGAVPPLMDGGPRGGSLPPSVLSALDREPLAEDVAT